MPGFILLCGGDYLFAILPRLNQARGSINKSNKLAYSVCFAETANAAA